MFITASTICSLLSISALAASGGRELLGEASQIVPQSISVGPNGRRFVAVIVEAQTKKRRVIINCRRLPGAYDMVAKGTPIFSRDGRRFAFVASRRGKCFVVVDGTEGRNYEITGGRWPIADLVFSPTGRHVAYKTRRGGGNYLVVDEKEFGPYDDVVTDEAGTVPGIGDFRFADSDEYFSYRAKTGGGMVACRGWIHDGKISLATSREYETIGAGSPVWLRGKRGKNGHLFAFIAREGGKEFIGLLPEPENKDRRDNKPKMYDLIQRGSLTCAPNKTLGFVARDENNKWRAIVGGREWKPCDRIGQLMHSPRGHRWACTARMGGNILMLVDGKEGPAYSGIRYQGTVFAAGDTRVVYAAVTDGGSLVVVEGREGDRYREVDGGSILFGPRRRRMAYTAGDGEKHFVILDGWRGPSFERVSNLHFSPSGRRFAYRSKDGLKNYVVIDGKSMGPYEDIAPGSPVFSPDGLTVAWAAMGEDANWRVHVDGKAGPAFDSIVSRLTFAPGGHDPVYVARILSEGKYSFALVSGAGAGREYTSIWMGDGGRLFFRDHGRVEYFAKKGPLVYKVKASTEADKGKTSPEPAARIDLPARSAWLKGDGISYQGGAINRWDEKAQARWDFICPADGTYEVLVSYGCNKDDAGGEFAVDIAGRSFRGKMEDTGGHEGSRRLSVGKVSLKKGRMYDATVRLTKKAARHAMHLRSLALVRRKD